MMQQKGFTLIELLTTLAVATILLSIAVPNMQEFRRNSSQTAGINHFLSGMRIARNTAITTNSRVTVCASNNGGACQSVPWENGWIAFVDLDADRTLDINETIFRSGEGFNGLSIVSAEFADDFIFRPNGRVMGATTAQNSGQFTVCDDRGVDKAKAIVLGLSGRPRVAYSGVTLSCS
ncbi:MAG: GspH/FimT family pseudopilin [Gammaproteobacteria bacterium]